MNNFTVKLVGRVAHNVLRSMTVGHIIAGFEHSFYVESDNGELMCLGAPAIGAGPLNALCELPQGYASDPLKPGVVVERRGDELRLGAETALTLKNATLWQPSVVEARCADDTLRGVLAELAALVLRQQNARGFGTFIPALIGGDSTPDIAADDAPLAHSWGIVNDFGNWLHETSRGRRCAVVPDKAHALIGLGPGLTPAGDDFLAGVMIALRWLGDDALAERIAAWVLPLARTHTNKISRAHLHCAANGEAAAALHDLLAVFTSAETGDLVANVDALGRIGHTSGWDALTGIVCACAAAVHGDTRSSATSAH